MEKTTTITQINESYKVYCLHKSLGLELCKFQNVVIMDANNMDKDTIKRFLKVMHDTIFKKYYDFTTCAPLEMEPSKAILVDEPIDKFIEILDRFNLDKSRNTFTILNCLRYHYTEQIIQGTYGMPPHNNIK